MSIYSLDIETRATDPSLLHCGGLEPFRVRQGRSEITSIAVCRPDSSTYQIINKGQDTWREEIVELLSGLAGKVVYAHNTLFDLAWMIATIEPQKFKRVPTCITDIKFRDTMLLTKWLISGQKAESIKFSYSLANLVATFLPEHPLAAEFAVIKAQKFVAGENSAYWEERGLYDVILTQALAVKMQAKLPEEQRIGLMTEFACLVPIANSWVNGIQINTEDIEPTGAVLDVAMLKCTDNLGVSGTLLNSPKQLSNLLFNDWGLKPLNIGKTGGSTAKDDLMVIQYLIQSGNPELAAKMNLVMEYKTNATLKSKYIKTMKEALEHTGDGYIYGVPRIFGTYTGRMSYSNTSYKNGPKVAIALHQLPRKAKAIRGLLTAPEGFSLLSNDAAGQESRLMAIRSGDEAMIRVFREGLNFHASTGAAIIGQDYYDFMEEYDKEEETHEGYYTEQRALGKLTNLSCNYRIGGKTLSEKAFSQYDTYMTIETGMFLVKTFKRTYPGVVSYWDETVATARALGYTESLGGRRYKLSEWGGNAWSTESSAINFPIQGSGADMKEIAIATLFQKFPEVFFGLDLHDCMFNFTDSKYSQELRVEVLKTLNEIDYSKYWGFELPCPLTYDSGHGKTFRDVK